MMKWFKQSCITFDKLGDDDAENGEVSMFDTSTADNKALPFLHHLSWGQTIADNQWTCTSLYAYKLFLIGQKKLNFLATTLKVNMVHTSKLSAC